MKAVQRNRNIYDLTERVIIGLPEQYVECHLENDKDLAETCNN